MKVAHLVAGAAGMVCGSCLHGNTLVTALRAVGIDAVLLPLYTPLKTDEPSVAVDHVAFGGLNVYLQQHSGVFRHGSAILDRVLDRPALLRCVAEHSPATRPERLGPLTVSMLQGETGRQRREVEKLVRWLTDEIRPQIVHLNNALLVGPARMIRRELGVPVVCSLTGEDIFLDKLPPSHRVEALAVLRERLAELDGLVALNRYFARFMADYLGLPPERIEVIRPGLNLEGHRTPDDRPTTTAITRPSPDAPLRIGFLARVCPDKGLHHLVEAVCRLTEDSTVPPVELHVAGYLDDANLSYLDKLAGRLPERFRYHGELDRPGKIAFLNSLDVMSVPTVYHESKGLSVLEAWANGVPTVLPAHGAFVEMTEDTGGGLLCTPEDPKSLAEALRQLLLDRDRAVEHGRRGQQAVHQHYHAEAMAKQTQSLYDRVLAAR